MTKAPYSEKLDADQQISTEECIAARISELTDGLMEDETCAEIGRDALYIVLQEFRPDLFEEPPGDASDAAGNEPDSGG